MVRINYPDIYFDFSAFHFALTYLKNFEMEPSLIFDLLLQRNTLYLLHQSGNRAITFSKNSPTMTLPLTVYCRIYLKRVQVL